MSTTYEARQNAKIEAEAKRRGLQPWQFAMMTAVDDGLLRDLMADNRRRSPTAPCTVTIDDPTPISSDRANAISDDLREVVRIGGWDVFSRCPATVVREAQRLLASGLGVNEAGATVSKLLR